MAAARWLRSMTGRSRNDVAPMRGQHRGGAAGKADPPRATLDQNSRQFESSWWAEPLYEEPLRAAPLRCGRGAALATWVTWAERREAPGIGIAPGARAAPRSLDRR